MDSSIAKFTRLLPLCIRKESGGGNGSRNQTSSSCLAAERGFFRDTGPMDPFKDPFESPSMNANVSPSASGVGSAEQKEVVRVSVTYPSPSCGAMNPHKEIALRLTNDENPMFFYHLRITEADYPLIKSQQGLLVDFYGFPNQLVTLLERCDPNSFGDADECKGLGGGGPKFVLVMKIGMNSVLDIVESNPFKYLCHLSLQINPGTDTEVKKYLADVTTGLKKDCGLWQEKYSHLSSAMETELKRVNELLQQKNDELTKLRDDIHSQANSLSSKHFQDMTVEKEKLLKMQSDLASKFESERLEIDRRHSHAASNLENRIAALEAENRDLIQIKFKNETTLQESTKKIKHLEDDLKILQQEMTLSRKQNEKLDKDYHEKHRLVNSLQNRLSVVESDLKEKQNTAQRHQDYITQISEQKKFLEDHATNMVEKLKSVNKSVSGELIKANEIIKKLQDDIRSLHSKNKLQGQITLEQERVVSDREKQIRQLEEAIKKQNTTMASLEESESRVKMELEESKSKIDLMETTIKSNENMISWLNKQLNEFQGLGNLTKFRQNLAVAGSGGPNAAFLGRSNSNHNTQEQPEYANNSTAAVNGSIRSGGLFTSNFQNSLPNGTPSWMHIYQSTSTPLDNDLSSRFERISATNNNYTLGRSRLDTISEKTAETNLTERNNIVSTANQEETPMAYTRNPNENQKKATIESSVAATNKSVKAPTWAKPRSGKVTLEVGAPTKPNPIWRK
ncbi:unnamed protein product [Orchesella dallaii]|uniref:Spindle assembly abnormal protein 6 N-terminal domain-containing protein n=1 Tax=Orchesella dallaii TaxID=48710 RepID=A0ABP1Q9I0_9HEXA